MTFEQAFLFYSTAPILFVLIVLIGMVAACYLTCLSMHLWHKLKGSVDDRSLCDRIADAIL